MESRSFMINTRRSGTLDRQHNRHYKERHKDSTFEIEDLEFSNQKTNSAIKKSENLKTAKNSFDEIDDIIEIDLEDFKSKRRQSSMMPKNFLNDDLEIKAQKNNLESFNKKGQNHQNDEPYMTKTSKQQHANKPTNKQFSVKQSKSESQLLNRESDNLKEDSELSKLNYYNTKAEMSVLNQFQEDSLLEQSKLSDCGYEVKDLNFPNEDSKEKEKALNIYPDLNSTNLHLKNDLENDYFKQLVFDTIDFIQTPPPKELTVRCKVIVIKGIFNEYLFYIEDNFNDYLLLKTIRKKTFKQFYYSINIANTADPYRFGTLYSDFSRNNFVLTGK